MSCLVPLASCLATGCIIPDAPEYGEARPTPIFIDPNSISPSPIALLSLSNDDAKNVRFEVSIRSEDANEQVHGALFVDYKHDGGFLVHDHSIRPGTLDTKRVFAEVLRLPDPHFAEPGCRTLTMMVMRESEWNPDPEVLAPIGAPPDLDSVTWFAAFGDTNLSLSTCPTSR